jgi:hypothetical protein
MKLKRFKPLIFNVIPVNCGIKAASENPKN